LKKIKLFKNNSTKVDASTECLFGIEDCETIFEKHIAAQVRQKVLVSLIINSH